MNLDPALVQLGALGILAGLLSVLTRHGLRRFDRLTAAVEGMRAQLFALSILLLERDRHPERVLRKTIRDAANGSAPDQLDPEE